MNGVPVQGHSTGKIEIQTGNFSTGWMSSYYFDYEYRPASTTTPCTGRQQVRESEWQSRNDAETFTVLYHPRHPKTSVVYRYCDYEVLP
jgi:hypothetical protein